MKDFYIRQVERALSLPRKKKREVLRDLQEIFDSGAEHGESPGQIIERLGSPQEFASSVQEAESSRRQAVSAPAGGVKRWKGALLLSVWAAAVVCVLLPHGSSSGYSRLQGSSARPMP